MILLIPFEIAFGFKSLSEYSNSAFQYLPDNQILIVSVHYVVTK